MRKILFGLFLSLLFCAGTAQAYLDEVTVKAEEAWGAAQEVLKVHGFKKLDEKHFTLETNWVTDRVVRSRGALKNFTSKTYDRRYRIVMKITQREYDSQIQITGVFQERPVENNQSLYLWQKYKPEGMDYDIERQVFMQILNRLELARTNH